MVVHITFLPLGSAGIGQALSMMSRLYEYESIAHDPEHASTTLHWLLENADCGAFWFIQADGLTVGYIVLTIGFSLFFQGRYGLLDEFYIDEEWRNHGIGTQALAFAQEVCRLRGLKAMRVEVGHGNLRAIALYERSGFEVHQRHLMTKWL